MAKKSKLKYKVYKRPIGPSGYSGATALESICIDGSTIWIIKCDIRGSNANKYARIYKLNLKNKKLKDTGHVFHNLGHANGCTFYNGCIYVATSGKGIARVDVSTWKSKKISDIYCTGIDYCGDNKFILQLGGNSYGLYSFSGGKFKKLKSFTLKRYGSYSTNQDVTYNGGSIYRVAITGGKGSSAVMVYNYDGGSGTYSPKKVYTCGGELESIVFYSGKAYISNNMSAPGDAIVTTSSFSGSDTSTAPSSGDAGGDGDGGGSSAMPIEYPDVVEITGFYEFYSGQDNSQVISFSPEWENMSAQGGEWLVQSASAVDDIRNEIISVRVGNGSYKQSDGKVGSIMGKSSSSMQNLETQSKSMWEKNYSRMNKATMEIMGDPDTYPGKYIYVDVYTKYGFRHHTSGIYYVEEAEDNISDGSFTTSLQLRKYGTYSHYYNSNLDDEDGGGSSGGTDGEGDSSGGTDYLGGEIGNPYGGKTKFTVTSIACAIGWDSAHANRMHDGWDYAVSGNVPIYAVTSGKVVSAGALGGYGNHVVVMKADGCNMYVLYGHMCAMYVKKGDKVKMGQKIGKQGTEGHSTGNHLHLEFRKGKNSSSNSTANLDNVDPMMKKYATNYSSIKKNYKYIKRKN